MLLQPLAQRRVEPLARQRDDDATPGVRTGPCGPARGSPPCFSSCSRPDHERAELLGRVAWNSSSFGKDSNSSTTVLVVVRTGDQVLGREDLLELVVQQRRLGGRLHVRLRREQADQPRLADDRARRARRSARRRSPSARGDARSSRRWSCVMTSRSPSSIRRRIRGSSVSSGVASANELVDTSDRIPSPEPGTAWIARPCGHVDELVLAVAEQHEVQLEQPVEEVDGLADLLRASSGPAAVPGELASCAGPAPASARSHGPPAGRRAGSRASAASRSARSVSLSRRSSSKCITDSRWLRRGPTASARSRPSSSANRPDHRVQQRRTRQLARRELLGDRVHQERRVVGVRLDDGPVTR